MLKRLWPYFRPSARTILSGGLLLIVSAGFELLQPWPVKFLVDSVFLGQPSPEWLGAFSFEAAGDKSRAVFIVCAAILLLAVLHKGITVVSQYLLILAGNRTVQRLRGSICAQLMRLSLSYHDRRKVGDSLYRIAYDAHAVQTLLSGAIVPMASGVILLVGIVLAMWRIDPLLTMVSLATTPVFWLLIKGFGRAIERSSSGYHQRESALVSFVQEALSSIRMIQAFTRERETAGQFDRRAAESVAANSRLTFVQLTFSACVGIAMALGAAAVVWFGANRVIDGHITVGELIVFLAYLGMLYTPMNAFSHGSSVAQAAGTQLARVFEVLDAEPEIKSLPNALRSAGVVGRIELRDVSFQYDADRPVLDGVTMVVEPGRAIALVGRTGAGKSTLASLLLRFYDPTRGAIRLDNHDLRELDVDWLRRQVSVVLQDPIILSATIAENIAFGRTGATRQQIETAARRAQLHEFIESLTDGYETELGERGVNLSGGQRQRLAIARAFVKDAPILVLDEPTSSLDSQTEEALLEALRDLMRDRTTIIIAHRLSTVRMTDRIFVLSEGRVVEEGPHCELMAADTLYRSLYLIQHQSAEGGQQIPAPSASEQSSIVTRSVSEEELATIHDDSSLTLQGTTREACEEADELLAAATCGTPSDAAPHDRPAPAAARRGFTLIELLVVIAIIGTLVGLLIPAIQMVRESVRKTNCASNLKQIGLALHNYEEGHKAYPAGAYWSSNPSSPKKGSILIRLLPYLEENNVYNGFDWNAPAVEDSFFRATGARVAATEIPIFFCPSDDSGTLLFGDRAITNYAASRGPTALAVNPDCPCQIPWQNLAQAPLDNGGNFAGPFTRLGIACTARQVTDGLSKTIFFGEVRPKMSQHVQNGWASSNDGNGYCSTLIPINYDTSNDNSPDPCRRTYNWNTEAGFKSPHSAGANFLFGDGAVRFVQETIDHQAYQYLGGKNDGQIVDLEF